MSRLIAFDPGTANMGMALFVAGGLVDGLYLRRPTAHQIALVAATWSAGEDAVWVRERMVKRPKKRVAHADLEAIERLCQSASRAAGHPFNKVYKPREWKGNISKSRHHPRLRKALDQREQALWDNFPSLDIRDAIGIGLFELGRVGKGGVSL